MSARPFPLKGGKRDDSSSTPLDPTNSRPGGLASGLKHTTVRSINDSPLLRRRARFGDWSFPESIVAGPFRPMVTNVSQPDAHPCIGQILAPLPVPRRL